MRVWGGMTESAVLDRLNDRVAELRKRGGNIRAAFAEAIQKGPDFYRHQLIVRSSLTQEERTELKSATSRAVIYAGNLFRRRRK